MVKFLDFQAHQRYQCWALLPRIHFCYQ